VTTVFTVRDAVNATLLFKLHHLLDGLLLDRYELVRSRGFVGDGIAFLHELIWPEKGPNVLYETVSMTYCAALRFVAYQLEKEGCGEQKTCWTDNDL